MKAILISLITLISFSTKAQHLSAIQPTPSNARYYKIVLMANGQRVMYQNEDNSICIIDTVATLNLLIDEMWKQMKRYNELERKYQLSLNILYQIRENGEIVDKKKFRRAVKNYINN